MGKWDLTNTFGQVHVDHGEPQPTSLVHYIILPRRSLRIQDSDGLTESKLSLKNLMQSGNLTLGSRVSTSSLMSTL